MLGLWLSILALPSLAHVDNRLQPRPNASVCEIVISPEAFIGRAVTVETNIESDGRHLSLLNGARCKRGLRFSFTSSVPQSTQDKIMAAIFKPWPGTSGKTIKAHFRGTVRRVPRDEERSHPIFFPYFFEVSSVSDLEIQIGKRPW